MCATERPKVGKPVVLDAPSREVAWLTLTSYASIEI